MAMEIATIDSEITGYLPLLGKEEKESLLGVIKSFLSLKGENDVHDFANIEQYNRELDEALARINAGKFTTQKEAREKSGKW